MPASPWRHLWPVANDPGTTYLNTAGEGPLATIAEPAIQTYLDQKRRPHTKTITDAFTVPASIRQHGAALIGADPAGCAVVPSTSYGMNIVAQGHPWQPGDRVLAFEGEFPACIYPFLNLADRGVTVDLCPAVEGIPDYGALEALLTPHTRMLVTSWVQFFNGFTHDLAHLRTLCDRVGALLVLDLTQGVGLLPINCLALGVDAATFSGHKTLCGPVGSGLFYLDPQHADP
ncbi:MAG TPA: aminotransferase class V-fold PLP-dependent enzyme, partial [bacterium]|nr:aminotransferase class V-fold PLP-dependent enzyme [bacterium]